MLRTVFLGLIFWALIFFSTSSASAQAKIPEDFRTTYFEGRLPINKDSCLLTWKRELRLKEGWLMASDDWGIRYNPIKGVDTLKLFESYFKTVDPDFRIEEDSLGEYLLARNGMRSISFYHVPCYRISEKKKTNIGYVYFSQTELLSGIGHWIIFDGEFSQINTLSWCLSYPNGYQISDEGIWDSPTGKGLRFRSFTELFEYQIPESSLDIKEDEEGFYLIGRKQNGDEERVFLDKK